MADRIRLAVAQSVVSCDAEANGVGIRALMVQAQEHGARLVHFPEGAVSGYPGDSQAKAQLAGESFDWAAVRRELELTAALAGELRLWVVLGGNHRLTPPHRPHNSLYVIADDGRLAGRYDKRLCSDTEITHWYTPGFTPFVFDVDGFRFGCALCIEINFPELFLDYAARGVDCVLFSSFSENPVFDVLARAHAVTCGCWISVSVPAQCSAVVPAGVIGPHGYRLVSCQADGGPGLACSDLDRAEPTFDVALHYARPWRAKARAGEIYAEARVDDPRSTDKTRL